MQTLARGSVVPANRATLTTSDEDSHEALADLLKTYTRDMTASPFLNRNVGRSPLTSKEASNQYWGPTLNVMFGVVLLHLNLSIAYLSARVFNIIVS